MEHESIETDWDRSQQRQIGTGVNRDRLGQEVNRDRLEHESIETDWDRSQ